MQLAAARSVVQVDGAPCSIPYPTMCKCTKTCNSRIHNLSEKLAFHKEEAQKSNITHVFLATHLASRDYTQDGDGLYGTNCETCGRKITRDTLKYTDPRQKKPSLITDQLLPTSKGSSSSNRRCSKKIVIPLLAVGVATAIVVLVLVFK